MIDDLMDEPKYDSGPYGIPYSAADFEHPDLKPPHPSMIKLIFGNGTIRTQQGFIEGEGKVLTIDDTKVEHPIGSTEREWGAKTDQDSHQVILVFKTLESARAFQDAVNEMCAIWSREINPKV